MSYASPFPAMLLSFSADALRFSRKNSSLPLSSCSRNLQLNLGTSWLFSDSQLLGVEVFFCSTCRPVVLPRRHIFEGQGAPTNSSLILQAAKEFWIAGPISSSPLLAWSCRLLPLRSRLPSVFSLLRNDSGLPNGGLCYPSASSSVPYDSSPVPCGIVVEANSMMKTLNPWQIFLQQNWKVQ